MHGLLVGKVNCLLHVKKDNITILLYAGIPITLDSYEHTIIVT
ncbi:hypothetical protein Metli_1155 [Methanofollis liminatans DSM 4140]|uniref:Uncharacterized protein n=1 Tax=Methanofollis liminatans DSM 4140 TaxID=28892 RepID=J1L243_9EURY|nr:hypothetical protein [Methanofollis liminatans]EJG07112.1 hypothetical protein Metli_1155 [Methanofollis liminatans DSM 4140]